MYLLCVYRLAKLFEYALELLRHLLKLVKLLLRHPSRLDKAHYFGFGVSPKALLKLPELLYHPVLRHPAAKHSEQRIHVSAPFASSLLTFSASSFI